MAATLTAQTVNRAGILDMVTAQVACTTAGDSFATTGVEYVIFTNNLGTPITLTLVLQATVDTQPATSKTCVVAAGKTLVVGPFPQAMYADGNGLMNITYSVTPTGCKIGCYKNTTT